MSAWVLAAAVLLQASGQAPSTPAPGSGGTGDRMDVGGRLSVTADALPKRDVLELRAQAALELTARLSGAVRVKFEGFAEGLVGDRDGRVTDAGIRVREAWVEAAGERGDLRAGVGRMIWGRLDELQPSDVINPLDTARFLFEGRNAARLPVAFVRGRIFASERLVLEGVIVPAFRRGSFDELDEPTSPFNLLRDLVQPGAAVASSPPIDRREPRTGWKNVSGGGRVSGTIGRLDVSAGAFRGFESFGVVSVVPEGLVEQFPRFTMVSGDFETIVGEWALRGEVAAFVEKRFVSFADGAVVDGRATDAGIGFDRRTGEYRVFGSLVLHREWSAGDPRAAKTDVSLVGSIERQFGRDRYLARAFGVVNPGDASGFVRGLVVWRARDNVSIEASAAAFLGTGDDTLSRFRTRDFVLVRVTRHF